MTVVVDASVVVAALVDAGPDGQWAEEVLLSGHLAAPHLLPAEVANVLRRMLRTDEVTVDAAAVAQAELTALPIDLFSYAPVASRAWQLRDNATLYDAWYVALAELLDAELATLDTRLSRAPGVACGFLLPPE